MTPLELELAVHVHCLSLRVTSLAVGWIGLDWVGLNRVE
jgi:hypothetical protein